MKPTKEQLADPKWWDENSKGYDCVFYLERNDEYLFADDNGEGSNFRLIAGGAGWQLLAKRPEPEWVPEVGEWFTSITGKKMAFIGIDSGNAYVCEIKGGKLTRLYDFTGCKPIKTQREELIDVICISNNISKDSAAATASLIMDKYDLTEKDGE